MLEQFYQRYLPALDAELRRIVDAAPVETPGFGILLRYPMGWVDAEGNDYHVPTGKRIRPILLLLCAEAAGDDWKAALPAAAAVEILHNFSLIHDDIQDNSPTRHGRPTVWKIWGSANAINAGDALFALAFTAMSDLQRSGVKPEIVLRAGQVFNQTALELTRGQHLDMRFESQPTVTVDDYISMISGKTSALLSACAEIGALVTTGDVQTAARYASFGLNLGIAFQIRDDILGIWGKAEVTGKSAATDIIARKKSLPVLYGLEHSPELAKLYALPHFDDADIQRAVALLDEVGAAEFARQQENKFYTRSIESLEAAQPKGEAYTGLMALIDALFQRDR